MAKLLLVDDDKLVLNAYSRILGSHTIFTANNGLEAVEILKNEDIDIVFTDVNMPKWTVSVFANGFEITSRVYFVIRLWLQVIMKIKIVFMMFMNLSTNQQTSTK